MIFWAILAVVLFTIDALTSTALLIGFSISALITACLSIVAPLWIQIICFVGVGILLTLMIAPKLRKVPGVKNYSDSLEGVTLRASCDMNANELYQEKVKGTFWNVRCTSDVTANQLITVIQVDKDNNCLIMKGE